MTENDMHSGTAWNDRFSTIYRRLGPHVSDIVTLNDRLQKNTAEEMFAPFRSELEQIDSACQMLSACIDGLTDNKKIDQRLAKDSEAEVQNTLRNQLRGSIDDIRNHGDILLEVLPGIGGESIVEDLLEILAYTNRLLAGVYETVRFSEDIAGSNVTDGKTPRRCHRRP